MTSDLLLWFFLQQDQKDENECTGLILRHPKYTMLAAIFVGRRSSYKWAKHGGLLSSTSIIVLILHLKELRYDLNQFQPLLPVVDRDPEHDPQRDLHGGGTLTAHLPDPAVPRPAMGTGLARPLFHCAFQYFM
jgi:hypothetical protein